MNVYRAVAEAFKNAIENDYAESLSKLDDSALVDDLLDCDADVAVYSRDEVLEAVRALRGQLDSSAA